MNQLKSDYDWNGYLVLAKYFMIRDEYMNNESYLRSSISRSYFSVLCSLRNHWGFDDFRSDEFKKELSNFEEKIGKDDLGRHEYVVRRVRERSKFLGEMLGKLKEYREWSDYETNIHQVMVDNGVEDNLLKLCELSYCYARILLENIDTIS